MSKGIQPGTIAGALVALHAARAWQGIGPGVNSPAVASWFDTATGVNHGALTSFDWEPGYRPRTNTETDKAVWHDFSGNARDGTLTGFGWTEASGWAATPDRLVCDGADDVGALASTIAFAAGADWTMEAWAIRSAASAMWLFGTPGAWRYSFGVSSAGLPAMNVAGISKYASDALPLGSVGHMVCSRVSGDVSFYVAGVVSGAPQTLNYQTGTAGNTTYVGRGGETANFWNGADLGLRVYSSGLSAAQVAQNYATGVNGTGYVRAGLVLDLSAARAVRGSGWAGSA